MKPPKRTRSGKDSLSPSTIGARIDNTMRLLMEISEEQAENELSKLGVDKENITESAAMMNALLTDNRYQQIQKRAQKVVPLVDWKYLLC